ncbi:NAD(P)-dependent oxidoreductase [Leptospira fluminis]|uniref:NAD(P)-dependent oxidoreductase n=1 Tax=Leptospira fluminis TaxID=2484979 RepID=UPI00143C2C48|nr:NAD(P)-dependent oxidoreductase [Leptospira fluminis]
MHVPRPILYYPKGTAGADAIFSRFRKLEVRPYSKENLEEIAFFGPEILVANTRLEVNSETFRRFPSVKIFATVSSGNDHVNFSDLKNEGRVFLNSPGCNAGSVAEYCWAAVSYFLPIEEIGKRSVGIVGYGNTGKAFASILKSEGIEYAYHDPYVKENSVSLSEIYSRGIVSFHVPLTVDGPYPTKGMFDAEDVRKLAPKTLVLNTSRGEIWGRGALEESLQREDLLKVIDVFYPEPPRGELLQRLVSSKNSVFTPHIAGYSQKGRLTGTYRLAEKLCILYKDDPLPPMEEFLISDSEWKTKTFLEKEDTLLREAWKNGDWEYFERRRNHYPVRMDGV